MKKYLINTTYISIHSTTLNKVRKSKSCDEPRTSIPIDFQRLVFHSQCRAEIQADVGDLS